MEDKVESTVANLLRLAVTKLPHDVEEALRNAYEEEDEPAKSQLKAILENCKLAEESMTPICQDTGIIIVYLKSGLGFRGFEDAIKRGVRRATKEIPLRPNAVHPLTRKNPGDNVGVNMPYINYIPTEKPWIELTVLPKGAGSENMSRCAMLSPAEGLKGVKKFVLETMANALGKACPPNILGIGIGGSADISMKLAKEALLRNLRDRHSNTQIAELEDEIYALCNSLGVGPMGVGGKNTVLGVKIEYAHCHTASLPVSVNVQCWAARRASARIYKDGSVDYLSHKR